MRKLRLLTAAAALVAVMGFGGNAWAESIKLFDSTLSVETFANTSPASAYTFNSTELHLTCPAEVTATLSRDAAGMLGIVVDNFLTINAPNDNSPSDGDGVPPFGTVGDVGNVCGGVVQPATSGANCFAGFNGGGAGGDPLTQYNPVAVLNVAANIVDGLTDGQGNFIFRLMEWGTLEANSDIYLVTNCKLGGIGTIKPDSIFTPTPAGIGRAVAFDGLTTLYYTFVGDANIYKATTLGVSLVVPIPLAGRNFTCGALSFDGTDLWCGTYDGTGMGGAGTGDVWTVNPTTGVANFEFTQAFNNNGCFFAGGFIDGLAFDASDNSLWLSDDGDTEIFHVTLAGVPIGASPFTTPTRPGGVGPGCNSGIEVAPGGFLELVLIAFEPGNGDAGDEVSHFIVKVPKDDISGTPIVSFPTQDPNCCEDLAFDALTFAPRAVVWADGVDNEIKAYDVQVTRTIGYWKNHPAEDFDGTSFLPIDLGDNDQNGVCDTAATDQDVEDILTVHGGQDTAPKLKAQLLAAELNLAMGDIPQADVDAILPVIDAAHELLGRNACTPDTGKKGDDRAEAQELHALLDAFNNKYAA